LHWAWLLSVDAAVVPATIVSRNHTTYVHYRGSVDAKIRPARRPGETATAIGPAGPPPGHEEKRGVGNQRKAEGEQPGHVPHTDNPAKDAASAPGVGNERIFAMATRPTRRSGLSGDVLQCTPGAHSLTAGSLE
jgi:hypothetical protein